MEALESLGYKVIATKGAPVALQTLRTHPEIALIFTDVEMPGMNGPELVQEARHLRPDLAVLYTSGYPANAMVHRDLLGPEVNVICKPFVLAELAAVVRTALDQPGK